MYTQTDASKTEEPAIKKKEEPAKEGPAKKKKADKEKQADKEKAGTKEKKRGTTELEVKPEKKRETTELEMKRELTRTEQTYEEHLDHRGTDPYEEVNNAFHTPARNDLLTPTRNSSSPHNQANILSTPSVSNNTPPPASPNSGISDISSITFVAGSPFSQNTLSTPSTGRRSDLSNFTLSNTVQFNYEPEEEMQLQRNLEVMNSRTNSILR
jgi:hypothetical protein